MTKDQWVTFCMANYKAGYYSNDTLKVFILKGKITAADYQTITGQTYSV